MTKRTLYARLGFLIGLVLLPAPGAGQTSLQPPCAACIAVAMLPGQVLLLPEELHRLTVLLRVPEDKTLDVAAAVEEVRRRGGRPGVLVAAGTAAGEPAAAFALRVRLSEIRGSVPQDTLLALELAAAAPWPRGLSGYADVLVAPGTRQVSDGVRRWVLVPSADLDAALAATRRGGAEQWVVHAPEDALAARGLLHGLASAAAPPPDAFTEEVTVEGARRLTVEEIVARHQAMARRQEARVTRTILTGLLTLTFEAPGFPAPITITSDTVMYQGGGRTELEQRSIRVNGLEFGSGGIPRLPILEPERVATPPLAITLTDVYRYRLAGEERIGGTPHYVVAFEPASDGASLFRGRAWITMDSFAVRRIAATQTRLRGAIVSSEQVDDFREVEPGIWLLARSDVRQLYEGAAHRTPIQRLLVVSAHEVNPTDFVERLQAAYASPSLMLRDTAEGYRYLKREPASAAAAAGTALTVTEVTGASQRVRTLAAGVIIDPNISIPLPFAGLSYVDFNLFGTGTQLNTFFGGSYGQLAFSVPSLAGSRWQLAGRAFGIASSYNDRAFRDGREIYEENVRQRPAHVSLWLLRPLTPRVSIRAGYELDYTRLRAGDGMARDFAVPADQVVHAARVALEGQRAGWSGALWWSPARRAGWRRWGRGADDYDPAHADFQRFGASAARSAAVNERLVTRIEASVMGGRDLDRFSRYAFGTFDNRLRGYPAALVRYDRGAVVRGAVAWAAGPLARLDGFVDTAVVRDRGYGTQYRNYTGVGAAVEGPLPFGLLASVEWGYGLRGVRADGGLGTHVVRVSAFKVF
ncbi:MAG TPA: hypothetical protein VM364_06805 [Vicinamibacterales bacterium]|nr:hypothetical protein [Vicinamibacterales bacterium]